MGSLSGETDHRGHKEQREVTGWPGGHLPRAPWPSPGTASPGLETHLQLLLSISPFPHQQVMQEAWEGDETTPGSPETSHPLASPLARGCLPLQSGGRWDMGMGTNLHRAVG